MLYKCKLSQKNIGRKKHVSSEYTRTKNKSFWNKIAFWLKIWIYWWFFYKKKYSFNNFWIFGCIILLATKPASYLGMYHKGLTSMLWPNFDLYANFKYQICYLINMLKTDILAFFGAHNSPNAPYFGIY